MKTHNRLLTVLLSGAMVLLAPHVGAGLGASRFLVAGDGVPTSRPLPVVSGFATSIEVPYTSGAASPTTAYLHGITVRLAPEGRTVVATCHYEGGTPVAGANVTLFAPGVDAPYLAGSTDPAGFYAFVPSNSGEWRIVVDDGMGHRREARIEVVGDLGVALDHEHPEASSAVAASGDHAHSHEAEGSDRPWKLATGLSVIVGLTGFSYGFTARRTRT
jgi:nickel transport protein